MFFPVIIQARLSSKRLPGKVLMSHKGITMLELMLKRLRRLKNLKPIIIATTNKKIDRKIVKFCKKKKIEYFIGSNNNVLQRYYLAAKKYNFRKIIRLTSDCPLIDVRIIKKLISIYNKKKYDFVSNSVPPPSKYPDGSDVEIFSFNALEKTYIRAKLPSEKEHVTFYMWKNKKFKKFKLGSKYNYSNIRYSLDYPEDFVLITKIMDNFKNKIFTCSTAQIINFLRKNRNLTTYQKEIGRYDGWYPSLKKDKMINNERK